MRKESTPGKEWTLRLRRTRTTFTAILFCMPEAVENATRARSRFASRLHFCRAMRFTNDRNVLELFGHVLAQAPAPHIAREQHLDGRGQRYRENRPKQPADQQSPHKDRDDYGHRVKTHRITDYARRKKHSFEVLDDDKNDGHPQGMPEVAPLKSGDEYRRNPANHDADVRDHRQDDNENTDERREIEAENCQSAADERAIDKTNEQLAAKVSDDVAIDLRQSLGQFVFERRSSQGQIIFPISLDRRSLF